jgi:hypothetical protein
MPAAARWAARHVLSIAKSKVNARDPTWRQAPKKKKQHAASY